MFPSPLRGAVRGGGRSGISTVGHGCSAASGDPTRHGAPKASRRRPCRRHVFDMTPPSPQGGRVRCDALLAPPRNGQFLCSLTVGSSPALGFRGDSHLTATSPPAAS